MPKALSGTSWWLQAIILALPLLWLYHGILARLVEQWWSDPDFSHGFVVPVFSGYLLWRDRKRLGSIDKAPSWSGFPIIAGAALILIVGVLGAELFLSRASLLFLAAGLVVYFLGWNYFRAVLFPWAFLFLMTPIPKVVYNQITFPLQILASQVASTLLGLLRVPVLREGNVIWLPTMALEVVEACSGIRSLMSLGALAILYGYLLESSPMRRTLLACSAVPIAVAANGLRIMGTGLLGYYGDPAKAEGFFHVFSGWVVFLCSLLMLLIIHSAIKLIPGRRKGQAI